MLLLPSVFLVRLLARVCVAKSLGYGQRQWAWLGGLQFTTGTAVTSNVTRMAMRRNDALSDAVFHIHLMSAPIFEGGSRLRLLLWVVHGVNLHRENRGPVDVSQFEHDAVLIETISMSIPIQRERVSTLCPIVADAVMAIVIAITIIIDIDTALATAIVAFAKAFHFLLAMLEVVARRSKYMFFNNNFSAIVSCLPTLP